MKVAFVTPASDLHKSLVYRLGHLAYEPSNSISGPLILGKILVNAGHSVSAYEELYQKLPLKKILESDVIGISTMTSTAPRAYELADFFRAQGKRVIMGGFHASSMPEESLLHCDQVLVGEVENVIRDVVEGVITKNIVRCEPVENMDVIPFPDYSLLKTPVKIANFITSRGCTHKCSFCTTTRMFHPHRSMSPERVIEAIRYFRGQGFERVNIQDDNFTADKNRAKRILRMIIQNDLMFKETFFFGRIDIANDEELLMLLKQAGFKIVLVGMESTNPDALEKINKRQTAQHVYLNAKKLTDAGMKLSASIILGLDGDTPETIKKTADFCNNIGAYSLQMPILTPFPGTPLYRQLEMENRILPVGWEYFDMMHAVYRPENMSPYSLQKLFTTLLLGFYSFASVGVVLHRWGFREAVKRFILAFSLRLGALFLILQERNFIKVLKSHKQFTRSEINPGRIGKNIQRKKGFRINVLTCSEDKIEEPAEAL